MGDGGAGWRRLPVFVASTFRDMDYERDVLTRVVIPTVNERIRERRGGVSLYPVDLRWGVETDDRDDLETRQRLILETCVREVRRCRPLFIGLVGGKYGWVPPKELRDAALDAAGLADPGFPLSVTALEIVAAAHAADGVAPILLRRQVPEEPDGDGPELLRAYLAGLGHEYQSYPAQWRDQRYESAEFAAIATKALLDAVDRLLTGHDAVDWLTAELEVQRWTAEREARQFVGRDDELRIVGQFWLRHLSDHDIGDDPKNPLWQLRHQMGDSTIAVVGASGSGKSALLAKIATDLPIRGWTSDKFEETRAYVQVGATPASERLPVCLLLLLAQLDRAAAEAIARDRGPDSLELDDVLGAWLAVLEQGTRLFSPLIVVDGLDRLHGSLTESQPMAWLPITLRDRVRVVLSAADDSFEATLLTRRPSTHVLRLGDLDRADALELVRGRVAAHHRAIPAAVVDALVRRATSPRWLVVATDLLLTLMAHDYLVLRRLEQAEDVDPEVAIRHLLESVAAGLPADLDGIHEEVFHRLLGLVDDRLGIVLCVLGVSLFGLGEPDLQTLLEGTGLSAGAVDFALFRDVLSVHVDIRRDEWRFAHRSAADGVDRLLDAASEAVGHDARAGYQRQLVRYLAGRPLDDPTRSRELLAQLLFLDEDAVLARGLAHAEFASDESVRIFGTFLGAVTRDLPAGRLARLVETAAEGPEQLTVVQVIGTNALPLLGRPESAELLARCRAVLATTPPQARSRTGLGPADLEQILAAVADDPLAAADPPAMLTWFTAVQNGTAGLRDLPARPPHQTDMNTLLTVGAELRGIIEYTFPVGTGLVPSRPDDPAVARRLLDETRVLADGIDDRHAGMRDYLRHLVATAARVCAVAWPDAGFGPEDGDFDRVRALADRTRGNADFAHLLGLCARAHAFQQLVTISDDTDVTEADAAAIHIALEHLEEAIWQLDLQLAITPDSQAIQVVAVQCEALRTTLLHVCDQQASAARAGIRACLAPRVVEVLGREAFVMLAGDTLYDWVDSTVDINPGPVVDRMIREMAEPVDAIEGMLLVTALTAARRLGEVDLAVRVAERAFALTRSGAIDPGELPVAEIVDEAVAEIEDDLLEVVEEGFEDEGRPLVSQAAVGLYALRSLLIRHRPAQPNDVAGGAFTAALSATLDHPEHRDDAHRLRRLIAPADQDPRRQRLTAAVDTLLAPVPKT